MSDYEVVKKLLNRLPDLKSFIREESKIIDYYNSYATEQMLMLCSFDGGGGYFSEVKGDYSSQYVSVVDNFFRDILRYTSLPKGKVIVCTHDALWKSFVKDIPVLCFGKQKEDKYSLMLPDAFYLHNLGYQLNYKTIDNFLSKFTWQERIQGIFWRGSSTGYPTLSMSNWRENPRYRLCILSKELNDYGLLDAAITQVIQCNDPQIEDEIRANGILKPWANVEAGIPYRYQLEIDGNASSWGGYQRYLFRSAQLKVDSKFEQWYHPLLEAGENYLPVKEDLSDLVSSIEYLRANDLEARRLADNSRHLAENTNYNVAICYVAKILNELLS